MVWALCLAMCVVVFPRAALALSLSVGVDNGSTQNARVNAQEVSGEWYLFLPAQADVRNLTLASDDGALQVWSYPDGAYKPVAQGASVDFSALGMANADGTLNGQKLWVKAGDAQFGTSVTAMQSANIRSAFVWTKHDISYIHASSDHSVSDTGTLTVLAPDAAEPVYDDSVESIRGRGNTTWVGCDKKPYQIKLPKKQDLLGTGEKTKTWLLLANAADPTLLRNTLSLKLANYLGSKGTPSCEPCDLYYNGEYRGSYLLTEKVKVEKNGVDIDDLDDDNEEANEGSDALANSWDHRAWSTNLRGNWFSYVGDLQNPSDTTGGYLVELDDRAAETDELSMFYTRTHFFTIHTPEVATRDEAAYVSELVGAGFDAAMNGGTDPETGKTVDELFDQDTLVATGLAEDFFVETDYLYSSTYFYVPRGTGRIYVGPVWDCDRSFSPANTRKPSRFDIQFLSGNSNLFKAVASRYYDTLAPTVRNVLLGNENAQTSDGALHSLSYYRKQIAASQAMDEEVWGLAPMEDQWVAYHRVDGKKWSGYVDDLASYMTGRLAYLDSFFSQTNWRYVTWSGNDINTWVPYENGTAVTDGWVRDGLTYYYLRSGKLQTGWLWDDGAWYYLDPTTGSMRTGWVNVAGSWYYLSSLGAMQTGWQWIDGAWYYFDASGAMQTGWLNLGGTWYYLYDSGAMAQGWLYVDGSWYWLDWGSGTMASNTWCYLNGTWYYFGGTGAMLTGWANLDGAWYYFGSNGAMATNRRIGAYYVGADGAWVPRATVARA